MSTKPSSRPPRRDGERNIALLLSYDGGAFHGWQTQKGLPTVQGTISAALAKTVGHPVRLHGCGRTDAGVHASRYVANFTTTSTIPADRLPYAVNFRLPESIVVQQAAEVGWDFHAINSLTRKEYTYKLYSAVHRDPFLSRYAMAYPHPMPLELWQRTAKEMEGRQDFAVFQSTGGTVRSTVRTVFACEVTQSNGLVLFRVAANGFLYNMVRAMVGTLLYVGEGKIDNLPALIASRDRTQAGPTVPPHGLYMTGTWYDEPLPWQTEPRR